ncbi:MAG: radical SAM protein [Elusimicrobia bacterium]|nr:radical SAM protein [Elusimicrobiota bacterium]
MPELVYRHKTGLYVNLTNRCPTACVFCIKNEWKMFYRGSDLNLDGAEPEAGAFTGLIKDAWLQKSFDELVFCGYGEPTMRLETLIKIARAVKTGQGLSPVPDELRIRLNTNGLGSLINGRDIVPELKGLIDSVHVSLITVDAVQWLALMRPGPEYARNGFESALTFVRAAARVLPETVVTAIAGIGADLGKIRALAGELGAGIRIRPVLD